MDDEKIEERFREIQDQIDAYTKRIGALEEDAKILAKYLPAQILAFANQTSNASFNETLAKRCREFVEKYGLKA
jgi:hypothetical protein